MNVFEAIRQRRSIRDFTEKPVPEELIEELLNDAILAPSSSNSQPWAFAIIQDKDMLKKYSDRAKAMQLKAFEGRPDPYNYRERLSDPDFNIFYNARTWIIIYSKSSNILRVGDCCLAAQNLMLSAYARGLGTCWIGFSNLLINDPKFKEELEIPEKYQGVAPIILGYPKTLPAPTSRKPVEIITWKS